MDRMRKASLAAYAINVFLILLAGAVYLSRSEFMPYQAEAVGMDLGHIPVNIRVLLLALIHAVGGLELTVGATLAAILICAFRRGEPWADWAVPTFMLLVQMTALKGSLEVAVQTGAHTPWPALLVGICITLVGCAVLCCLARRRKSELSAGCCWRIPLPKKCRATWVGS